MTDKDGKRVTVADVSRSWYLKSGGRNNARITVERLKKTLQHSANVNTHCPKFITLTFADALESWEAKRAVQKFLNTVRTWAKRHQIKDLAYFWTAEVQMKNRRGALHYHIIFLGLPFISITQWRTWWKFGFLDVRAVDNLEGVFKYLAKYSWKWGKMADDPDNLPDWWFYFSRAMFSKRHFGFSNWYRLSPVKRIPGWLRKKLEEVDLLKDCIKAARLVGGGWRLEFHDLESGAHFAWDFASLYQIVEGARVSNPGSES